MTFDARRPAWDRKRKMGRLETDDVRVLLVAEDELSSLAEHYRVKLNLDGYRVTFVSAARLTAQQVRDADPDFVVLEIHRLTPRIPAVWAKIRWAGGNRLPIIVVSSRRQEALNKIGIKLDRCDHLLDWSGSSGLWLTPAR